MVRAGFNSLPAELRIPIWQQALDNYCRKAHRIEITFRDGEIYPLSRPPALLHVNRESRYITLLKYKPWLPQFDDTPQQRDWKEALKAERHTALARANARGKPSRLNNVCINFEQDTLVIQQVPCSKWDFAPHDLLLLRSLALNLSDWLYWPIAAATIYGFENLRNLTLSTKSNDTCGQLKKDYIQELLRKRSEDVRGRAYRLPLIVEKVIQEPVEARRSKLWTSYRFNKAAAERRDDGDSWRSEYDQPPKRHMRSPLFESPRPSTFPARKFKNTKPICPQKTQTPHDGRIKAQNAHGVRNVST